MDAERLMNALARALVALTVIEYLATVVVALVIAIPRRRGPHRYPAARLLALAHGSRGLFALVLAVYAYIAGHVAPSGIAEAIATPFNGFVTWTVTLGLMCYALVIVRRYNRKGARAREGDSHAPH